MLSGYQYHVSCLLLITVWSHLYLSAQAHVQHVTCGSVLKLQNGQHDIRLHSHDIKYGSGSGQQSVTGTDQMDDNNSHWVVKGKKEQTCTRGEPIGCGTMLRLEHLTTHKNLHSHHFSSPLSGNQEVSAFGDNGQGDTGDNWIVVCSSDYWERGAPVRFKHVDTDMWLCTSGNTYGRPIGGQMEICATSYPDAGCYWKTAEGVFVKPSEGLYRAAIHHQAHSEL
ncbi:stromal cell-derived factor 2-like isoform X1 [Ornithodoros turicata]|uniref:stromal cell-derived factor 2-like isoform X1 n=1 Tax=Ornithodoros turicata TaxID=34597 RepID=UPI0031398C00